MLLTILRRLVISRVSEISDSAISIIENGKTLAALCIIRSVPKIPERINCEALIREAAVPATSEKFSSAIATAGPIIRPAPRVMIHIGAKKFHNVNPLAKPTVNIVIAPIKMVAMPIFTGKCSSK